jgi:DNA-binding GntR family transcriptional regulator
MSLTTTSPARAVIHRLVEGLTLAISQGQLLPGQRLVEADLQQEFGVSRSSVREALQMLQASGLVVIAPNKGAAVRSLDANEINELFAIREQRAWRRAWPLWLCSRAAAPSERLCSN